MKNKKIFIYLIICLLILSQLNIKAKAQEPITINITGLASGSEASHDCSNYLVTKYDNTQHWQECNICGKIYGSKTNHTLKTIGSTYCIWSNDGARKYCENCGYLSAATKDEHILDKTKIISRSDQHTHYYYCTVCHADTGWLGNCINSAGQVLGCSTGISGYCRYCGHYYSGNDHIKLGSDNGKDVYCGDCKTVMFSYEDSKYVPLSANSARISMTVTYWNKSVYGNDISSIIGFGSVGGEGNFSYSNKKINYQNGKYYISADITFPYEPKSRTIAYPTINIGYYRHSFSIPFEYEAPKITSANIIYGTQINGYSVKAKLSISCTDNWNYDPNYIQFRLVDKYKNGITNWITCNKQNNTYSQICDLAMEVNGIQTFYIQARDASGNLSERPIEIKNLDSKAPAAISNDKTSTNWTTQKEYKAEAIDDGVGNVKIAFNDNNYVEAIKNDNTYSQNYIFIGDVYGSTIGAIYYKDALENKTTQFITISNIDNTAPTITDTKITYEKTVSIEVSANDNKDFGGDVGIKEGSGIAGYAISESKTAPDTFQTSNILEVPKTGDYYIYVKDNVGNIQSKHIGKIKTECEINTSYIGVGSISNSSKTKYTENTSIYIVPADGFQISKLKIDNVLVNPVKQYDFISIEKDHKVEATFTITQSKKMELMQKGYSWIDLKL